MHLTWFKENPSVLDWERPCAVVEEVRDMTQVFLYYRLTVGP